jgi:hypothetical protein
MFKLFWNPHKQVCNSRKLQQINCVINFMENNPSNPGEVHGKWAEILLEIPD